MKKSKTFLIIGVILTIAGLIGWGMQISGGMAVTDLNNAFFGDYI